MALIQGQKNNMITCKQWPLDAAQLVLGSRAKVNWCGCYSTSYAESTHVTLNRKNRLCFSWFFFMKTDTCINLSTKHIHRHGQRLQAHWVQYGLRSHITHIHTHSFVSCSNSVTFGMKTEECPHFTCALRCFESGSWTIETVFNKRSTFRKPVITLLKATYILSLSLIL